MKILLFGEFSGLHKNLKEGLEELGHDVTLAATRDGFKKIPVDIDLDSTLPGYLGKAERILKRIHFAHRFKSFDIVQMMNAFSFGRPLALAKLLAQKLIGNNQKFFLLAAGGDAFSWQFGRKRLSYGPQADMLKYDLKKKNHFYESERALSFNIDIANRANGIIPVMFEYETSYRDLKNVLPTIPLPINLTNIVYDENRARGKLVVFHGLNRYGAKGTRHVEEAFKYLRDRFPNDLELIIAGKMPLTKYLGLLSSTNVVIDQMYSYSLGMNGLYSLAMGKVVLGGAEPEGLKALDQTDSPVINLKPNAQSIITAVKGLLENRHEIPRLGYESRKFVEAHHSHTKVADQYVKTWASTVP